MANGISNDTTVIFYGEPPQFGTYAWWVFKYLKHPDVRILNGGWKRWQAEGRPLTSERSIVTPATYEPPSGVSKHMRASREEVLVNLDAFKGGSETVLLDHRSPEEFRGDLVNVPGMPDVGAERYGRIPGSRHLHFTEFLNPDSSFKAPEELEKLLAARGATRDKKIVSYCRLSHRATLAYFVMTELLGYKTVKSYDGSWTEWGSMVGMPIER
jgi:thiosulfate/3-mercaptopyruvate sulfurtransferase